MEKRYKAIQGAIPYVNGQLHLGHALLAMYADLAARYYRLDPVNQVLLTTGTDEHGNKIFEKAQSLNLEAQEFVDKMSSQFQETFKEIGIGYDRFVRTSNSDHKRRVRAVWQELFDKGFIYKADYKADYCLGCESFKTATVVAETDGICPDHNQAYQKLSEPNYFLKSTQLKDKLRTLIESDQLKITPLSAKKATLKLLEEMEDDSISRPVESVKWGIETPTDPNQRIYVWFEALLNYVTILGYPDQKDPDFNNFWPSELIVIGRDILRFHSLLLPAILLALDQPIYKNLFVHGLITIDGQKMSKTIGNIVDPRKVVEKIGSDSLRYYLLSRIRSGENGKYSFKDLIASHNNELVNDLGNLIYRLQKLCQQSNLVEFKRSELNQVEPVDYHRLMTSYQFDKALAAVWDQIRDLNKQLEIQSPWKIEDQSRKVDALNQFVDKLVGINYFLRPFLPKTSDLIDQIFAGESLEPIDRPPFVKIETDQDDR